MQLLSLNPCYWWIWYVSSIIFHAICLWKCLNPCYWWIWYVRTSKEIDSYASKGLNPCYWWIWYVRGRSIISSKTSGYILSKIKKPYITTVFNGTQRYKKIQYVKEMQK